MMRLPLAIGCLATGVVLYACDPDRGATGLDDGDGSLHGSVSTAKTGEGVPNLVIALVRDGRVIRTTPTDISGGFEFRAIARGEYVVRITGVELSALSARHTAFEPLSQTVVVDRNPTEVLFAAVGLIPPRIVGYVRCGGVPVADARVRVIGGSVDQTVTTNAQGKYGATDLTPGEYAVLLVAAPCTATPPFGTASLRAGQAAELDFEG